MKADTKNRVFAAAYLAVMMAVAALAGGLILLTASALPAAAQEAPAMGKPTLYVAPAGHDVGSVTYPGTSSKPFATVVKADSVMAPDDTWRSSWRGVHFNPQFAAKEVHWLVRWAMPKNA